MSVQKIEVFDGVQILKNGAGYYARPVWSISLGYAATLGEMHGLIRTWRKANPEGPNANV